MKALDDAKADHSIESARRAKQRAYLMHWSWKIAKEGFDAQKAEAMEGVNIEWWHGSAEKSRQAAQEMVDDYGINDLDVEADAAGHENPTLIAVAKTYGVVHFIAVDKDKTHWSTDGK